MNPDILSQIRILAKEGKDSFSGGWEKKILGDFSHPRKIEPYVYGQARFNFRLLLPGEKISTLLEFGSGLGLLTAELKKQAQSLVSYNSCFDALDFFCKKKMASNTKGFFPVNGSQDSKLPFKSQSFEAVLAPYELLSNFPDVLGEDKSAGQIETGRQKEKLGALLKEFFRILKPGGRLIFPATNRFDYETLPQKIKERKFNKNEMGKGAWEKCLQSAGFSNRQILGVYPNWKDPEELYLLEEMAFLKFKKWGLKETLKRHPLFCSSYIILAEKPGAIKGLNCQETFLKEGNLTRKSSAKNSIFGADRIIITGKDKWVAFVPLESEMGILKVPLEEMALREEEKNLKFLNWAQEKGDVISKWVPRPLFQSEASGLSFFLESQISGSPFSELIKNLGRPGAWKKVEEILEVFSSVGGVNACLEGELYEKWVGQKLEAVAGVFSKRESPEKIKDKFKEMLWGKKLKLSITHGDFSVSNLMAGEDQKISGVFDWGWGSKEGPAFLDSLNFLDSAERLQSRNHLIDNIRMLLKRKWRIESEFKAAQQHLENCGFGAENWESAVYYFWLYTASARLADNFRYDSKGIQKQILDFAAEQNLV